MSSFFMNPITMMVGLGLVATPIIIHLINRMRFRRVKWAAMEFLLKAQKKMRRKKILEQLLLLLLRCLLVFLAGLLFARFLGFDPLNGKETRPVLHVVVLDDTPSMADTGEAGAPGDAFSIAKTQITEKIMKSAAKATTPQRLRIIRLSDQTDILNNGPDQDKDPELINSKLIETVQGLLAPERPATIRVGLPVGLKKAKAFLDKNPGSDVSKVVHVVSDMRSIDWTVDGDAISQAMKELTDAGAKIHLIDVATPYRTKERKTPVFSDNVGIVELKPRNRVAAVNQDVSFDIRVKNFGNTDLKNVMVELFLNGQGNLITTLNFETLPANQEMIKGFQVRFNQAATKEDPLARFNVVSAVLKNTGADAIASDNVRHAVVEVREKLSALVITRHRDKPNEVDDSNDKNGESYYLRNLFEQKFTDLNWVAATPDALVKQDLREYSSIFLLNVPSLTDAETTQLERYIQDGGGVGVFLGDRVTPEAYTKTLYRGGSGFFPFPFQKFNDPPSKEVKELQALSLVKRVLLREPSAKSHPALRGIYEDNAVAKRDKETADMIERSFMFARIFQHWKVERIGRWREDQAIKELYCLPNDTSIEKYVAQARALTQAIRAKYGEAKFANYRKDVDALLDKVNALVSDNSNPPLTELARQMDRLLADQVSEGDAAEALLREFWSQPEMTEAKAMATSLRDSAKYGDPLYIARRFGNGRVGVFTVPTGGSGSPESGPWTEWPAGGLGALSWGALMLELQGYLAGGGAEENRSVGSTLEASFEAGRYKPSIQATYLSYDVTKPDKTTQKAELIRDPKPGQTVKEIPLDIKDGSLRLSYSDTKRPGVYVFTLTWQKRDGDPVAAPSTKPEYMVAVFNPDTEREGDLKRASSEAFETTARGADVHAADEDWTGGLEQRPTDLSSGKWIFLLILLFLIFEQAMAVRLSYHRQAEDLEAFAPSAAAAMAGRTAVPTAEAEAVPAGGTESAGPAA